MFVLREAFALPYDEVAEAVGKSPAACRQLHVRARAKLADDLPPPARSGRRSVLERLLTAVALGDVAGVTALLADDALLVSDGGGVVSAARRPVQGADRVARFLVGVASRAPAGVEIAEEEVNGAPAVVVRQDGAVTQVLTVDVDGERVAGVQIAQNPGKLSHLDGLPRQQ